MNITNRYKETSKYKELDFNSRRSEIAAKIDAIMRDVLKNYIGKPNNERTQYDLRQQVTDKLRDLELYAVETSYSYNEIHLDAQYKSHP